MTNYLYTELNHNSLVAMKGCTYLDNPLAFTSFRLYKSNCFAKGNLSGFGCAI